MTADKLVNLWFGEKDLVIIRSALNLYIDSVSVAEYTEPAEVIWGYIQDKLQEVKEL